MNPYNTWLGINITGERPNHYALLGLEERESRPALIREAFERQLAKVRRYQIGQYEELAQQVTDQLSVAFQCLTDPQEKAEYDRRFASVPVSKPASEVSTPQPPTIELVEERPAAPTVGKIPAAPPPAPRREAITAPPIRPPKKTNAIPNIDSVEGDATEKSRTEAPPKRGSATASRRDNVETVDAELVSSGRQVAESRWWARIGGIQVGPLTPLQLRTLIHFGRLHETDEIRAPGTDTWFKYDNGEKLESLLAKLPDTTTNRWTTTQVFFCAAYSAMLLAWCLAFVYPWTMLFASIGVLTFAMFYLFAESARTNIDLQLELDADPTIRSKALLYGLFSLGGVLFVLCGVIVFVSAQAEREQQLSRSLIGEIQELKRERDVMRQAVKARQTERDQLKTQLDQARTKISQLEAAAVAGLSGGSPGGNATPTNAVAPSSIRPKLQRRLPASGVGNVAGEQGVIDIPETTLTFRWCPPGSFLMGTSANDVGTLADEKAVSVTLTQGFWIHETETTREIWEAVKNGRGPAGQTPGLNYPMSRVLFEDAEAFCQELHRRLAARNALPTGGWRVRLPTEAEWEYACRAGTTTPFSFGATAARLADYAWFEDNSFSVAHPVASKNPNPWGLFDMHGNVWEWCLDWYTPQLPGGNDPLVKRIGNLRVMRGGSWSAEVSRTRSAYRGSLLTPNRAIDDFGFRIVVARN